MITYVNISLFDSPAQALVNTVNTVGVMGKGIAAIFKKLYPKMYQQYRRLCNEKKLNIGILHIYRTPNKIIVNFPTKKHWRNPSRVEYIEAGLEKFVQHYTDYGISSVSFPQLGCGNGELNWQAQVQPVMEHYLQSLPIPVYIHLYCKPPNFVPERLDRGNTEHLHTERQRISAHQFWQDLQRLILQHSGQAYQLTLFGPTVEIDEEHILFKSFPDNPIVIYRDEMDDLWNSLRLRGTVGEADLPQDMRKNGVTPWLFELLQKLDYIQPIVLREQSWGESLEGLQYTPRPETTPHAEAELVV